MNGSSLFENQQPLVGGQIIIEPGMTCEQTDSLLALLARSEMKIARVRMFEAYMRGGDGGWDFSLFDAAFDAAERHGVFLLATLFPFTSFEDVGGFKFPENEEHYAAVLEYVRACVAHFAESPACAGWVLVNEPGVGRMPVGEFVQRRHAEYLGAHPVPGRTPNGYPAMDFRSEAFLLQLTTRYLQGLADEVRAVDPDAHVHLNPHGVFGSVLTEYDFPSWRGFLDSFGGSAHPSWHFGLFSRDRYAVAMAATCSIIASAAGDLPWMMTEVQGGANTYSGATPISPTAREIAQWLWIVIASGGRGAIFWSLNQRSSGFEAGEWGLVSLLGSETDRFEAARAVASCIGKHESFFRAARPIGSPVSVLYVRESLWVDRRLHKDFPDRSAGRALGAPLHSALGWYEALCAVGLQPRFGEIREFDFESADFHGQTIVLSHQIAVPASVRDRLRDFVDRGGRLIVDGLTSYFDEHAHCVMMTGFPFADLFGGRVEEVTHVGDRFDVTVSTESASAAAERRTVPAHLWKGSIRVEGGRAIAVDSPPDPDGGAVRSVLGLSHRFGLGETIWIPSCLGLGARVAGVAPLASLAADLLFSPSERPQRRQEQRRRRAAPPLFFQSPAPGVLLRAIATEDTCLVMLISKNPEPAEVTLAGPASAPGFGGAAYHHDAEYVPGAARRGVPEIWFADGAFEASQIADAPRIRLKPEQTLMVAFRVETDQARC